MVENQFNWVKSNQRIILLIAGWIVAPAMAYYQPESGRFMQRDPLGVNPTGGENNPFAIINQFQNGINMYEYVKSEPVNFKDPYGLFPSFPFGAVHGEIESAAFKSIVNTIPNMNQKCQKKAVSLLIDSNGNQDWFGSQAYNDERRHYTKKKEEDAAEANIKYRQYLFEEITQFATSVSTAQCESALKALGRMNHAMQDFFAHAVTLDGSLSIWNSGTSCDPYNIGGCRPINWPDENEHPYLHEPYYPEGEYDARLKVATELTKRNLGTYLTIWATECSCWCNK